MSMVLVRARVREYGAWKKGFDGFKGMRRRAGEKSYRIYHIDREDDHLLLLFEWESHQSAQEFFESTELEEAMEEAGVIEAPEVYYLDLVERGSLS